MKVRRDKKGRFLKGSEGRERKTVRRKSKRKRKRRMKKSYRRRRNKRTSRRRHRKCVKGLLIS